MNQFSLKYKIMKALKNNPRMSLIELSELIHVPKSTVYDNLNYILRDHKLRGFFVVKRR